MDKAKYSSAETTFGKTERDYCEMLECGGIFVGDRWFDKHSSATERAKYLLKFERRVERNRRRRERYRIEHPKPKKRAPRRKIPNDLDSQRVHRLRLERRKCLRRTTLAKCPTPNEIRTAWHFRNASVEARIRLGGLMLDLECYVDNSLITVIKDHKFKIVGRIGGLRAWIRENCPELEGNYKSLQRIKGYAKRMRQSAMVFDPVPVAMLLDPMSNPEAFTEEDIHIQPRPGEPHPIRDRFVWEHSPVLLDADGREYRHDENYWLVNRLNYRIISANFEDKRRSFKMAIILNRQENCTNENYMSEADERGNARGKKWDEDMENWGMSFGIADMIKEVIRDPTLRRDMVKHTLEDIGDGFKTLGKDLLPQKTRERMENGEQTSIGRFVIDVLDEYADFYQGSLVYRIFRG